MKYRPFFILYLYAVVILFFSSIRLDFLGGKGERDSFLDYLLSGYSFHFFAFGLFAFILGFIYLRQKKFPISYLKIGLSSAGFGFFIEVFQIFIPYRHFDLIDLISDFLGVTSALLFFRFFPLRIKKKYLPEQGAQQGK